MERRNKIWESIALFFKTLGGAIREVFGHVGYALLATMCAALVFIFMVYLPNLRLIGDFVINSNNPLSTKFGLLAGLLGGIETNSTVFSATIIIAISVLFGMNFSMLIYQWKQYGVMKGGFVGNLGGIVSGIFGIGCSVCGSFLGTAIFASLGASGVVAFMPLHGGEFGIVGIALLLSSIVIISRAIQRHGACPIPS